MQVLVGELDECVTRGHFWFVAACLLLNNLGELRKHERSKERRETNAKLNLFVLSMFKSSKC